MITTCLTLFMLIGPCQQPEISPLLLESMALRVGFPDSALGDLQCIAQHESSYRPWVVSPNPEPYESDYGLFQINGGWVTGFETVEGYRFDPFLDGWTLEDLNDPYKNTEAAFLIWQRNGNFNSWHVYEEYCND